LRLLPLLTSSSMLTLQHLNLLVLLLHLLQHLGVFGRSLLRRYQGRLAFCQGRLVSLLHQTLQHDIELSRGSARARGQQVG
jgi:hypothetical protein